VLAMRVGDEEDLFDISRIRHDNIRWWVQTPRTQGDGIRYGNARLFGVGFPPHFNCLPAEAPDKDVDVFLAAQDTHSRRHDAFAAMEAAPPGWECVRTEGFTQGLPQVEYVDRMLRTKLAPAPSGPESPDTFRFYEALEAHAIPVADLRCPSYAGYHNYWAELYPWKPFPALYDWARLGGCAKEWLDEWPATGNRVTAWWMEYKRGMARNLAADVAQLSGQQPRAVSDITVVIPMSVIPSHPSTSILDETVASVRHWLPDSEIIVTMDGLRADVHPELRGIYHEAIRRVLWRADHDWRHVRAVVFDQHAHQIGMMRSIIDAIDTPLLLYVEQDTPLVTDEPIDFAAISSLLHAGEANVVRLHHEGVIPEPHEHMMLGQPRAWGATLGGPLTYYQATSQWSQRPHVSTRAYYRRILNHFSPHANCFLEDVMHGVVDEAYLRDGVDGWLQHRLYIYLHDNSGNIKRSYHLDGRASAAKHDEQQVF
jgi:hypothetical protein